MLVHLFQRTEKTGEGAAQVRRTSPGLPEIPGAELIADGDGGGAHRPVFVSSLGPRNASAIIDPQPKAHSFSSARLTHSFKNRFDYR
jgi:hypothetical protein